jgi:hypothetical protein
MKYLRGGSISAKFIENYPELFTDDSKVNIDDIVATALKPVPVAPVEPAPTKGGRVKRTRKLRRTKPRKSKRRK